MVYGNNGKTLTLGGVLQDGGGGSGGGVAVKHKQLGGSYE